MLIKGAHSNKLRSKCPYCRYLKVPCFKCENGSTLQPDFRDSLGCWQYLLYSHSPGGLKGIVIMYVPHCGLVLGVSNFSGFPLCLPVAGLFWKRGDGWADGKWCLQLGTAAAGRYMVTTFLIAKCFIKICRMLTIHSHSPASCSY